MTKNALTTIFGSIAGIAAGAHQIGITIGHIGSGDVVTLLGAVSTVLFGYFAADAKKAQPATTAPQGTDSSEAPAKQ